MNQFDLFIFLTINMKEWIWIMNSSSVIDFIFFSECSSVCSSIQVQGYDHWIPHNPAGKKLEMEAVFRPEIYWIFSGAFLPEPAHNFRPGYRASTRPSSEFYEYEWFYVNLSIYLFQNKHSILNVETLLINNNNN